MVVLSVGGSIVNSGKINVSYLKKLGRILSSQQVAIVVGGGRAAREYAHAMRQLTHNEFLADECAILSTKQNAQLIIAAIGPSAFPIATNSFSRAREAHAMGKSIVMFGTIPGITTDTDSVLLAESIGSKKLINVSSVNGIYDKDPSKHKGAKKFSTMTHAQLIELANACDQRKAGTNFVFDIVACKLAQRSKIELHFVSNSLKDIEAAIRGKKHSGTVVKG